MKIFGKKFVTKKQLKEKVAALEAANTGMLETFPFKLGQVVYDLQLKNESGRYTKKNASMEHSVINEVVVSEKNYFSLVTRYRKHDVFMTYADADSHLASVCK